MTPERWRQIDDLVQAALDCSPDGRGAFLESNCRHDPELRKEVEALLAFENQADGLLNAAVEQAAVSAAGEAQARVGVENLIGTRIGSYRILREIGRGGMGVVYLAQRDDDQFEKKVAIKKVLRGMDTDFILQRFRQERQILAGLEHPYIARLHDGGSTEDGHPYLVMEYVDGEGLIEYATHHNLDVRARLDLFRRVCSAVHYAHQNLVVHRDLKPSNILVTREGFPKLLDFGIAKLLIPSAGPRTSPLTGSVPMTPEYASPEQVRGRPVTTATDVYALGAILYELLTGVHAHRITTYTPMEMERVICQEPPSKPSRARSSTGSAGAAPDRELSGDLDNIVLKAMQKEPSRRYASAAEFSEDIRSYLDGRPVIARQDSLRYRSRKFITRHKTAVVAAALTGLSLVAGTTVATLQARRAERRFEQVKLLARSVLYDIHDSIRDLPGSTKARELVVTTALKYLDSLASEAKGDASLQRDLVDAYQRVGDVQGHIVRASLGDTGAALKTYQKALEIAQQLDSSGKPDVDLRLQLVELHNTIGNLLSRTQNKSAAVGSFSRAIEVGEPIVAANEGNREALRKLASAYENLARNQTDSTKSLHNTRKHLAMVEKLAAADPDNRQTKLDLSNGYSMLGVALERREDLTAALELYQQAVAIREALILEDPSNNVYQRDLMIGYSHLGDVYGNPQRANLGDRKGAMQSYGRMLAAAETLMKADPSNKRGLSDYAIALSRVAAVHDQGLPMLRTSTAILESLTQADKMNIRLRIFIASNYSQIARLLEKAGDTGGALRELRRAEALGREIVAADARDIQARRQLQEDEYDLARLLAAAGDRAGALEALRKSEDASGAVAAMDPGNLPSLSRPARALGGSGAVMATLAAQATTPEQRQEDWRAARERFQRSLDAWRSLQKREGFGKEYDTELNRMQAEIERADRALAAIATPLRAHK
jgi:serine/threonine protein kinase/tetratricopeptide (TPR) repeat protein